MSSGLSAIFAENISLVQWIVFAGFDGSYANDVSSELPNEWAPNKLKIKCAKNCAYILNGP